MSIVYRYIKGSNLTAAEVDGNFETVEAQIAEKAAQGVGIAGVTLLPNDTLQFQLTDHSYLPPVGPLPTAQYRFRGTWAALTAYLVNDTFSMGGSGYVVLVQHTSAATFDPNATDGSGHNLYGLYFAALASLPAGGATGAALTKRSTTDYDTIWAFLTLASLADVSASPPAVGDLLQWDGHQFSYIATSSIASSPPSLKTLTDVQVPPNAAPTDGQIIYWNDGDQLFEFKDLKLRSLSDVQPTINSGPRYGEILYYDDTTGNHNWYNAMPLNWRQMTVNGYTFSQYDTGRIFDYTGGTPTTVHIPTNASQVTASGGQGFAQNARIGIRQHNAGQVTLGPVSGVNLQFVPPGKLPATAGPGATVWIMRGSSVDYWIVSGDLADDPTATAINDSFPVLDLTAVSNETWTYTPTQDTVLTTTASPFGRRMTILLTTSGTTSYTVTFGGGFQSSGPIVTGSVSGVLYTISFVGDGTNMNEVERLTGAGYLSLTGGVLSGPLTVNAPLDSKSQVVSQSGTTLAINRALGDYCTLAMSAAITTMTVTGWPAAGTRGRLRMEIVNGGAFNITGWPTGTIWPGGTAPTITSGSGKRDMIELTTNNGGTTIYGRVLGQNFS